MSDYTRGDDPVYNSFRQHWPKSVDIEENQVVVDKAAWEKTIEANERYLALFIEKVRAMYAKGHLYEATRLCQDFMGVDAKEAFKRVKMLCDETVDSI